MNYYKVETICGNCGVRQEYEIEQGTPVKDRMCDNCDIANLITLTKTTRLEHGKVAETFKVLKEDPKRDKWRKMFSNE